MKKKVFAISLLSFVVVAHAASLPAVDQNKFNAAIKAYRSNQNTEALRLFTELYKDFPQNQQIKNNYAVVLFSSGKIEQAEEVLSSVIENDKEVNVAFKNLNKIYDYAAAKAYSNALGTEKEVQPQKLQLIETLVANDAKATDVLESKPVQVAENTAVAVKTPVVDASKLPAKAPIVTPVATSTPAVTETPSAVNKPVTPAAEAVATPAPTPEAQKLSTEAALEIVNSRMQEWVSAWGKGDVNAYANLYTPNFAPDGLTHKSWLEGRKLRINPSKKIQVQFSDLTVVPSKKSDTIVVNFKQSYKASQYQDNTSKQLVWKKVGDKWLIEDEIAR